MTKIRTGLLAIMATVVMLFAMAVAAVPALAEDDFGIEDNPVINQDTKTETAYYFDADHDKDHGSITIDNANAGETYKLYKVFDATVANPEGSGSTATTNAVSYRGTIPTELADYFSQDAQGNITAKEAAKSPTEENQNQASEGLINALNSWVSRTTDAPNALVGVTLAEGMNTLKIDNLPYGYYYITTTSGTAVTIDTTHPTANVVDKNSKPSVDKIISGVSTGSVDTVSTDNNKNRRAIAEVGSTVTYQGTVTTTDTGRNFVYHDKMDNTLTFNTSSVKVYNGSVADDNVVNAGDNTYSLVTTGDDLGEDTFQVKFADSYIQSLTSGTKLIVQYTATVNSNALLPAHGDDAENPAKNAATLTYGNNGKTESVRTKVYNAQITLTKDFLVDGNKLTSNYPVAGFVLRKGSGDSIQYYKEDENTGIISWVSDVNEATEKKTAADSNQLEFKGLANGAYTLIEKTVPDGYNKAADEQVTIYDANTTQIGDAQGTSTFNAFGQANLMRVATISNTQGSLLPTAGGPGTTLMYIIGAALVIAAAVALIARRKSRQQ